MLKPANLIFRVHKVFSPLNYNVKGNVVTIEIDSKSNFVDTDEWTGSGEETEELDDTGMFDLPVNELKLKFRIGIQDLKFEDYDIKRILTSGLYENNILKLDNTDMIFSGSTVRVNGVLNNFISWGLNDGTLSGKIKYSKSAF